MAAASIPSPSSLQTLPQDMQEKLFSNLETRELCALSTVCKDLHTSISTAQARESAIAQRVLKAYLSPAPVLQFELEDLDESIYELENRLRQIRMAPVRHRDLAEETSIERRLNSLRASRLPQDRTSQRIIDLVKEYHQVHQTNRTPFNVIDTRQWNAFIRAVLYKPLLPGTEPLLSRPCPIFHGKTMYETHVCIVIPPIVGGKPLTLKRMMLFAGSNRGNEIDSDSYDTFFLKDFPNEFVDAPIPAGQYLLLKTCLPGTKSKTYQEQLEVLREYPEYVEATLSQVLVASLMEYIRSGEAETRLFYREYARTSTTVDDEHLSFGGGLLYRWPEISGLGDSAVYYVGLAAVLRSVGSSPVRGD